jgi:hypothetical protein
MAERQAFENFIQAKILPAPGVQGANNINPNVAGQTRDDVIDELIRRVRKAYDEETGSTLEAVIVYISPGENYQSVVTILRGFREYILEKIAAQNNANARATKFNDMVNFVVEKVEEHEQQALNLEPGVPHSGGKYKKHKSRKHKSRKHKKSKKSKKFRKH